MNNAYRFIENLKGYTFTQEEAKEIKSFIDESTHQSISDIPYIDATIPDLLIDNTTHVRIDIANDRIREAFRRGHKVDSSETLIERFRRLHSGGFPCEVKDLMWSIDLYKKDGNFFEAIPNINEMIVEAYRRGREAGSK